MFVAVNNIANIFLEVTLWTCVLCYFTKWVNICLSFWADSTPSSSILWQSWSV